MQARSRLQSSPLPTRQDFVPQRSITSSAATLTKLPELPFFLNPGYAQKLPTLVFSLFWYGLLFFIISNVRPQSIQNFLIPNFYLPFQIVMFLANWFLGSYVLLNTRRGLIAALFFQSLVFLKFQQVILSWQISLGLLLFFVIIERLGSFFEGRPHSHQNRHANIQKSFHRRRRTTTRSTLHRSGRA